MEEGGAVGRQDDGDLGGEERKIFEEPLPDMWLWKVAEEGGGVYKVFAVCRECTLFPYTHVMAFSRGYTWMAIDLTTFYWWAVPYAETHPLRTPVIFERYCSGWAGWD